MDTQTLATDAATSRATAHRRWYFHPFNRVLSWQLILGVTPKLPRFILVPLHHVTSFLFFACVRKERRNARRNLERITGKKGLANLRLTYRLFYNFSRFMVAYTEIGTRAAADVLQRTDTQGSESVIRDLMVEGNGLIIVSAHLGHWDLGLKLLQIFDRPVHVVMLDDSPAAVRRFAEEARDNPSLRVHEVGSPMLAVELMLALKRGEVVTIQTDRPVGQNVMSMPLFGAPAQLPTGPAELAIATGAPLLPVFIVFGRGQRYRVVAMPVMRFARSDAGNPETHLRSAMSRMVAMLESVIARYPDQWFNFYDVWAPPHGAEEASSDA